jgi:hypothetical protein
MTEVRDQRSAVKSQRAQNELRGAEYAELFICALCASLMKSISDFRFLISGLCALLLAFNFLAEAQQPKVYRIGYLSGAGHLLPGNLYNRCTISVMLKEKTSP